MAKVTPTTKTCNEICRLITGSTDCDRYRKYVLTTFDPTSTHALYGVHKSEVDTYKDRIKSIGGKYIRVVSAHDREWKIICFALEITPQEALEKKMKEDHAAKMIAAYESKLVEVKESILLHNAGATDEAGLKNFANYLINGTLDPLLPFESYVYMDSPSDKDEQRIYDIVNKANIDHAGNVGMVTTQLWKMCDLARLMNSKITDEDKRARRRAACIKYGLNFLAKCFEKTAA